MREVELWPGKTEYVRMCVNERDPGGTVKLQREAIRTVGVRSTV